MPVTSDFDAASPTGMVLSYLRSKGLTPDANNVRSALETQARGGNLMPGLVTEEPPPADQRNPSSTSKNVAAKVESSGNKPVDTGSWDLPDGASPTGTDTSAQPGPNINLSQAIMYGLPALGAGAGAYGAYRYMSRPNYQLYPNGPDVAPDVAPTGDQYRLLPPDNGQSPMQTAMDRAMQPAGPPQLGSDVPDLSGVRPPPVNPADVIGKPGLPPGVTNLDAVNAGQGVQGVEPPLLPPRGKPTVRVEELPPPSSFRSRPPMRLRIPG